MLATTASEKVCWTGGLVGVLHSEREGRGGANGRGRHRIAEDHPGLVQGQARRQAREVVISGETESIGRQAAIALNRV